MLVGGNKTNNKLGYRPDQEYFIKILFYSLFPNSHKSCDDEVTNFKIQIDR